MIVCPNCNHQNPKGATHCEACYTPLPVTTNCPNCGAKIQTDATFCGQCGSNLRPTRLTEESESNVLSAGAIPPTIVSSPLPEVSQQKPMGEVPNLLPTAIAAPVVSASVIPVASPSAQGESPIPGATPTKIQQQSARLIHIGSNAVLDLPQNVPVIHIGKPNDLVPPDIEVSGFPHSEVVSRLHADIRLEGDAYFIEDVGSSNGTYINNIPLPKGNRHRLKPGDRISLGKGDLVSFVFQLS
ncbi:MAG: FHA domain-containing protein [Microcoleaceae cyanobacterium]